MNTSSSNNYEQLLAETNKPSFISRDEFSLSFNLAPCFRVLDMLVQALAQRLLGQVFIV